jgi:tetratricopeptide (TPR) repeat protein
VKLKAQNEKDSTTADVLLDDRCLKTRKLLLLKPELHHWLCRSCRFSNYWLFSVSKFVAEPKQLEAADEMFVAQENFQTNGVASDSLYKLSLNGSEGKFGLLKLRMDDGTDAGNLNYYAGMAYLNTGKYNEAIDYLNKFKSDDIVLSGLATGAIGDAYAEDNKPEEALKNYVKAAG